jgi:hypothetical protein
MRRSAFRCLALLGLLAAACAPAPQRPSGEEAPFAFRTARTPYAAAICIARNARADAELRAEERTVGRSSTEVLVRDRGGETLAVARVDNDGVFSRVALRVTAAARGDRAAFARRLMAGC